MFEIARTPWQRLRAGLRRRLGFSQAEGRDVDFEQALLRSVIGSAVLIYGLYVAFSNPEGFSPGLRMAVIATSMVVAAGLWMMWWFKHHTHRPARMRYFGICADVLPMTIGLLGAGEYGVPLVGIYLWLTVGNGFRFGPRFLLFAYALSGACFTLLLIFVPYWQEHRYIGFGFGFIQATIPLYVLVLLSRLTAQKDAALELSNAKSRFVANVSHELRTPLTGVFAVYELLRRRRLTPDERELIGSLGSAIGTLKSSVDAVLQMSKLEAGAERTEARLFNLRYFLQQMAVLSRPQAAAKGLSWSLDVDGEVPGTVVGDPAHLQHIIGNLLNNAFKFTAKGGVTLRVTRVLNGVRFEVSDTGIGIPLDHQESLFERFVQADASATRRYGGTGLGTSIAHDLVKLMGGAIGVYSAPGHGATFWVELPLGEPARTTVSPHWDARREVLLLGPDSVMRAELVTTVAALGLTPVPQEASLESSPSFEPHRYLAALLLLPAPEAAVYADTVLRDRAGALCPWLVVTPNCSSTQAAALLKAGAVALLPPTLRMDDWHRNLAAFTNSIDLPSAEAEVLAVPETALSILLADDNQSNQMLLARILSDAGHTVSLAARGDEAYDLMVAGNLDLAILDLNMPEMSGPDVVKLFRAGESGTGQKLPIIILSADATAAAQELSLSAGANDYLTKPVTAGVLLSVIERVMAGAKSRAKVDLPPLVAAPSSPPLPVATPEASVPAPTPPAETLARPAVNEGNTAAPTLVDPDRIEALRRIAKDDPTFLKNYTTAAFADVEAAIGDLRKAMAKGDAGEARGALHKIDGTGASIGAVALIASSKNMRNYLTGILDADGAAALAEISTTCALTKSAVAALLRPVSTKPRPH